MHARLLIVLMLSLLFLTPAARAGFVVKKTVLATGIVRETANAKASQKGKINTFITNLHRHMSIFHPGREYRPYHPIRPCDWYGIAAIGAGVIGLLVPGVNLLAILFGALGMGRRCGQQGLSIAGFVMGILELVLFLIAGTVLVSLILL